MNPTSLRIAHRNVLTGIIRYGVGVFAACRQSLRVVWFALFVTVLHLRFSILSGALTLVCLLLPTMIRTTEEALEAVPVAYREGSMALGVTKWHTISRVVLPAATPGLLTAVILCIGRVIGAMACLYVTLGGSPAMPHSLLSGGRTLSLQVFYLAMETRAYDEAFATAAVLIIIVIIINTLANWLARRFHAIMSGE